MAAAQPITRLMLDPSNSKFVFYLIDDFNTPCNYLWGSISFDGTDYYNVNINGVEQLSLIITTPANPAQSLLGTINSIKEGTPSYNQIINLIIKAYQALGQPANYP